MTRELVAIIAIATAILGCDRPSVSDISSATLPYKDFITCSFDEAADPKGSGNIIKRRANEVSFAAADSDSDSYTLDAQLAGANIHTFGFDIGKLNGAFQVISSYRENGDKRTNFPSNSQAIKTARGTGNSDSFDLSLLSASGEQMATFIYESELIIEDELVSGSGIGKLAFAGKNYKLNCLYAEEVEL